MEKCMHNCRDNEISNDNFFWFENKEYIFYCGLKNIVRSIRMIGNSSQLG